MSDTIDHIVALLNKLYGLPAVALVAFSCLVVGYILRYIKAFHNSGIPVVVVLWGGLAMSLVADSRATTMPLRVWIVRNVLVGLIVGFLTWLVHRYAIKRLEDFIASKFPSAGGTRFFSKSNTPTTTDKDEP